MWRIGMGYDLHRTEAGRPLILGGVRIESAVGLAGHSDADVVLHAVSDALLGAAGLGDIGELYPDTDPAFAGADSAVLLRDVVQRVAGEGLGVVSVDVTVVAERPKLSAHKGRMRETIGELVGLDAGRVGVKAKTNEGVDAVGRGEAIACYAVALVGPREG